MPELALTLAEVKAYLRIDPDRTDQDATLLILMEAVQDKVEGITGRGMVKQERTLTWDGRNAVLAYSPIVDVVVTPSDITYTLIGNELRRPAYGRYSYFYHLDGRVEAESLAGEAETYQVVYQGGYETCPAGLKESMLALIDHIYYSRGTIATPMPGWIMGIIERYSVNLVI